MLAYERNVCQQNKPSINRDINEVAVAYERQLSTIAKYQHAKRSFSGVSINVNELICAHVRGGIERKMKARVMPMRIV